MNSKTKLDITIRRVVAKEEAKERDAKEDYRRKIEYIRTAVFILRSRVEHGQATAEDEDLLRECEMILAVDAADGEAAEDDEDTFTIPPRPSVEVGIEVPQQAMPIHGYHPAGVGSTYWYKQHNLPIPKLRPRRDDIVEHEGNLYTVIEEVTYFRLIPCAPPPQSRESSRPTTEAKKP